MDNKRKQQPDKTKTEVPDGKTEVGLKKKGSSKRFWDRVAKLYDLALRIDANLYKATADAIKPYLSPKMRVLELACGTGLLTKELARCVAEWDATDYSAKMIDVARAQVSDLNVRFRVEDATGLLCADATFDAVLIANALHVMPEPEKAMAEIRRVLKRDGLLFAPTFIHGQTTEFRLRLKMMDLFGFEVVNSWTAAELGSFIEGSGFKLIELRAMDGGRLPSCFVVAKKK